MSHDFKTGMKKHTATRFCGDDERGMCLQITSKEMMSMSRDVLQEEGFIQLDIAEAAALAETLGRFIEEEAKRRQELLAERIKELEMAQKTVFHEVANLDAELFKVPVMSVDMVCKFCPTYKPIKMQQQKKGDENAT